MISLDPRYAFMFGSLTVNDTMTAIIGRIFRVPVNNKPITIFELTGLPSEIINVVVSVLCRLTFDFALWSEGQVPVTLVCEEAHRYVPANSSLGFEPCKRAIAKIAKEGRKYGASLCIVTQRPAEIDPTILSQCNTVFALRMSNDRDQEIVKSAIADTGSGLLKFLSALGQREAIAFGDGVTLPVRLRFDELPKHCMPRSSTASFTEKWQKSVGDDGFLEAIVERWRSSSSGSPADAIQVLTQAAEAMAISAGPGAEATPQAVNDDRLARPREPMTEPPAGRSPLSGASSLRPPLLGASSAARCEPCANGCRSASRHVVQSSLASLPTRVNLRFRRRLRIMATTSGGAHAGQAGEEGTAHAAAQCARQRDRGRRRLEAGIKAQGVMPAVRIMRGHKMAADRIAKGQPVLKFGQIIGFATEDDRAGSPCAHPQLLVCRVRARLRLRSRRARGGAAASRGAWHVRGLPARQRQGRHAQLHRHPHQRELLGLRGALHGGGRQPLRHSRAVSQRRRGGLVRARHRLRARRHGRGLRGAGAHTVGLCGASQSRCSAGGGARVRGVPDRAPQGEVRPGRGRQLPLHDHPGHRRHEEDHRGGGGAHQGDAAPRQRGAARDDPGRRIVPRPAVRRLGRLLRHHRQSRRWGRPSICWCGTAARRCCRRRRDLRRRASAHAARAIARGRREAGRHHPLVAGLLRQERRLDGQQPEPRQQGRAGSPPSWRSHWAQRPRAAPRR